LNSVIGFELTGTKDKLSDMKEENKDQLALFRLKSRDIEAGG